MLEDIGPFEAGDRVRASWLQRMLLALRAVINMTATPPLKVTSGPNGLQITLAENITPVYDAKVLSGGTITGGYQYTVNLGYWNLSTSLSIGGVWAQNNTSNSVAFFAGSITVGSYVQVIRRGSVGTGTYYEVLGVSGTGSTTSPTTIGSSSEGSETADSSTWTRGTTPVEAWITCRDVYNDAGDKVLYTYRRKFTFDTLGALFSISGETRITVDTPEAC